MNIIKIYKGNACILCNKDTENENDICMECLIKLLKDKKGVPNETENR